MSELYVETAESKAKWEAYRAAKQAEYRAAGLLPERARPTVGERRMELLMAGPAGDDSRTYTAEERAAADAAVERQLIAEGYAPSAAAPVVALTVPVVTAEAA